MHKFPKFGGLGFVLRISDFVLHAPLTNLQIIEDERNVIHENFF